jgi:hypothetical protein
VSPHRREGVAARDVVDVRGEETSMAAKKAKKSKGTKETPEAARDAHLGAAGDKAHQHRDAVVRRTYKELLPVRVGQDKVEEAMKQMAKLHHEEEELDKSKRQFLSECREKSAAIKNMRSRCVETIDNSTELREVECVDRLLPTGVIESVRVDKQELWKDARVATADERQEGLPGFEPPEEEDDEELPGPRSKAKAKK